MMKAMMNAAMDRRSRDIMAQIGDWLPREGPLLDLGSGTGHLAAHIEEERKLEVVTADVSDFHVVGRAPVVVSEGTLPFESGRFTGALLVFMLGYPRDPAGVLS
jgi:hypothetical protein